MELPKVDGEPYSLDCISCYFDGVEDPRVVIDDQRT
jgi:hypothetical protein